jgi:zinc transport system ATP-binding protein
VPVTTTDDERPAIVRMRDVTIGYGERAVVREADLTVRDGEVVAVLGANGSGKTTLVRGLLGLAQVMHGEIELGGRPVHERRDRARIGYVPQRHTVGGAVPSTVREVVSSGRLARLGWLGRMRTTDRRAVQEAIDAVQLSSFADADVSELSGGQQRRVLIARALAAEPTVLVMDEPTAGVDRESQRALAETIRSLAARGVPMIVVTHEAGPLADVFTRAVVVSDGRIVSDGPVSALRRGPDDGSDDHHHEDSPEHPAWLEQPMGGA